MDVCRNNRTGLSFWSSKRVWNIPAANIYKRLFVLSSREKGKAFMFQQAFLWLEGLMGILLLPWFTAVFSHLIFIYMRFLASDI